MRTLVANRVEFGPNSGAAVVIAARVEGDVRPLLDWRGALAFGARRRARRRPCSGPPPLSPRLTLRYTPEFG